MSKDPSQAQALSNIIKTLCQNNLVRSALHLIEAFDLFSQPSNEQNANNIDAVPEVIWLEQTSLLHAAVSKGFMQIDEWDEARMSLRRWKSAGFGKRTLTVPVEVANSMLRVAAQKRHLPTLLEILETIGAVGTVADETTFEVCVYVHVCVWGGHCSDNRFKVLVCYREGEYVRRKVAQEHRCLSKSVLKSVENII